MKKTLIALLCVLVACITFVACNNQLSNSNETSISFTPSVGKALNQSADSSDTSLKDVNLYYWKYYCSTTEPSTTFENNTGFKAFFDDGTKGLGIITGVTKYKNSGDPEYYFGLRGYSDSEFKNLVWEGYSYSVDNPDVSSDEFKAYQLTSRNVLVTVDVFGFGKGYLEFNITAPYNYDNADVDDDDKISTEDFETSYFKVEYQLVGSQNKKTFYLGKDATNTNTDYVSVSKDFRAVALDSTVSFDNTSDDASEKAFTSGVYLFTISQVYEVGATEMQVPNRKQVMIVNVVTGAKTLISGSLDSTLGEEEFYYNAKKYMTVIFHTGDTSTITTLKVTNASDSTVSVSTNAQFTVDSTELSTDTKVEWFINGVLLSSSATDKTLYNGSNWSLSGTTLTFTRGSGDTCKYIITGVIDRNNSTTAKSFSFTVTD